MLTAAYLLAAFVVGFSLVQGGFALIYSRLVLRACRRQLESYCPKAAIILAVRGSDPFLVSNMLALLNQDYPDYTLFIVVDSEQDAAWPEVRQVEMQAPERVVTMVLNNPLPTCSLKCSSLAEAVEQLDASYEVVAFVDGDASPHRTWLRELVAPLADETIGVTTGNRWYTPKKISMGSMVRYFWNAAAIVQVWYNGIIWAGSMALRRDVIDRISLVDSWRKSLSVDGAVVRQLRTAGLKAKFVPTVIVPNREDISIARFITWSERQLVAARSSGTGWANVLVHAFAIATCVFAPPLIIVAGLMENSRTALYQGLTAMIVYWVVAMLSALTIEYAMQRVLTRNQVQSKWMNLHVAICYLPAVVLSHSVYFCALAGATFRTRVWWRGIEYRIGNVNDVRMVAYQPYRAHKSSRNVESIV